jgi:hypothetical protein
LVLVTAWKGQPAAAELRAAARRDERPRKDYVEIADGIGAEIVDGGYFERAGLRVPRGLARRDRFEAAQVLEAFGRRRHLEHVVAWGDRLGLGLGALCKATRARLDITMVSHLLSTHRRARFIRLSGATSRVRKIINYSSVQMRFARDSLHVDEARLELLLQPVDHIFWRQGPEPVEREEMICAVGSEARDYPTLIEAVRGLPIRLEVAVGSMVMAPGDHGSGRIAPTMRGPQHGGLPSNVRVRQHLTPVDLRELYRRARFVVIPLRGGVEFDAGVTAITEALAMARGVVVSQTPGQVDVVHHEHEGLLVPPGDVAAMRRAILRLLEREDEATRYGEAGRALVEERHTLDRYVRHFVELVAEGARSA